MTLFCLSFPYRRGMHWSGSLTHALWEWLQQFTPGWYYLCTDCRKWGTILHKWSSVKMQWPCHTSPEVTPPTSCSKLVLFKLPTIILVLWWHSTSLRLLLTVLVLTLQISSFPLRNFWMWPRVSLKRCTVIAFSVRLQLFGIHGRWISVALRLWYLLKLNFQVISFAPPFRNIYLSVCLHYLKIKKTRVQHQSEHCNTTSADLYFSSFESSFSSLKIVPM